VLQLVPQSRIILIANDTASLAYEGAAEQIDGHYGCVSMYLYVLVRVEVRERE